VNFPGGAAPSFSVQLLPAFFLLPFVISWLLTNALLRLAPRFGLVDDPNARKVHTRRIPRGGGLAIYAAMTISAVFLSVGDPRETLRVLALGLGIVLLGLIDDLHPLSWQVRLGVQTTLAVVAVISMPIPPAWYIQVGAVFWIVGLTNAFNMLDNMDALSAGVAWVAAGVLAAAPVFRSAGAETTTLYLVFMGALSGFLWFNRPPARIFMGDAGSTFLGFFLGLCSFKDSREDVLVPQRLAVALCIFAVPWYDLILVVALRLWQRRSPFHADKQHLSHRLVRLGLRAPMAVCVIYALGLASGASGLLLYEVDSAGAVLVIGQLACWWCAVAVMEYIGQYRSTTG
jgi:UDP-GlcNAc:undecaprenyl-phosphate GlcNAc-1-phosphate transferase